MSGLPLLDVAAQGMAAQRAILDVAARNLAAAQATPPGVSYDRLVAQALQRTLPSNSDDDAGGLASLDARIADTFASVDSDPGADAGIGLGSYPALDDGASGTGVAALANPPIAIRHERADGDALTELIALLDAQRAYEADASVFDIGKRLAERTLEIGQP